ncbi:uncharacterized protein N7483_010729 [Penicillium malachiteum]|uniref:uncharacterized protein n=1 Tax=Penicillium malachiteum TaxID=1324776 RepID=UPI002548D07F|nr:uncharacterized protein N7483_010729 [Penicillium malachiteum]KAJ5713548.1 hypothetical protein N7483_010729 [Penicillium malachiteum]
MASFTAASFLAEATIAAFLETHLDSNVNKVLRERKTTDPFKVQTPIQALDEVLREGNASPESVSILRFLKALLNYCSDAAVVADPDLGAISVVALAVCGWILQQLNPCKSADLEDELVKLLFPKTEPNKGLHPSKKSDFEVICANMGLEFSTFQPPKALSEPVLIQLQHTVFNGEPLRVMCRVLDQGLFGTAIKAPLLAPIRAILVTMAQEGHGIGTPDLLTRAATRLKYKEPAFPDALEVVQSLKVLAGIAEDPRDVPIMYRKQYRTLREITQADKQYWITLMIGEGMAKQNALKIYDCAERVDCWNENMWLSLMQSRRAKFTPIAAREIQQLPNDDDEDPARAKHNLTDIFKLEDIACETCCSVTSLSAYFADLLSLLKSTPCGNTNLLEILSLRRPDLTRLELTCANAQTLVPYVSLVNEVLESFIIAKNRNKKAGAAINYDSVRVFNTPDSGHNHSETAIHRPGNTILEAYKLISKQMFPFADFPYSQARDTLTQYFATFHVTMLDLAKTFQAPESVLGPVLKTFNSNGDVNAQYRRIEAGVLDTFERYRAAEILGLQLAEFVAITGETFYPKWLAETLMGLSKNPLAIDKECPWTAADLWGYDATTIRAKMQNEADAKLRKAIRSGGDLPRAEVTLEMAAEAAREALLDPQRGISRIKKQLMRRSGLNFQSIFDLVKTQCFSQHLVITNLKGSGKFTNSLEELRLMSGASEPPFRPLTEETALALQSFMRVQAKLGWSTKQLDAAVVCFRTLEMSTSPHIKRSSAATSREVISITPFVLKALAAVVELSQLCKGSFLDPIELLPLWGPIDCFGEDSLMHRKFLSPAAGEVDKLFFAPLSKSGIANKLGDYFKLQSGLGSKKLTSFLLSERKNGICVSLGWPIEFFDDLLAASGQKGEYLNVPSFSALYQQVLLCKLLSISAAQFAAFFAVFRDSGGRESLASPMSTVSTIRAWKTLLQTGWTVSSLSNVLNPLSQPCEDNAQALAMASSILQGAQDIRKSVPFVFVGGSEVATTLHVADCAARTFDSSTATTVTDFIEGSQVQLERVDTTDSNELQSLVKGVSELPYKIKVTPEIGHNNKLSLELQLTGILSAKERDQVKSFSTQALSDAENKSIIAAVLQMADQAVEVRGKIATRFGSERFTSLFKADWPELTIERKIEEEKSDVEERLLSELALQVRARRKAFIELAGPTIIQDLLEAYILNLMKDLIPDLDVSIVAVIISRVVRVASASGVSNDTKESVMSAMKSLSEGKGSNSSGGTGTTGATSEEPHLTINGITLAYSPTSRSFMGTRMRGGQAYLLKANFASSELQWSTPKLLPASMTDKMLLPSFVIQRASTIISAVMKVATICRVMSLTAEELGYFASALEAQQAQTQGDLTSRRMLAIDLNAPSIADLIQLQQYSDLRRNTSMQKTLESQGTNPLLAKISWLSTTSTTTMADLTSNLVAGTRWDQSRMLAAIKAKYGVKEPTDSDAVTILTELRNMDSLHSLYAIMQLDERLGKAIGGPASRPSISTLFQLAQPPKLLSVDDSDIARTLQTRLMPDQRAQFDGRLMENQRRALVAYLLQQQYVRKDLKIWDADGLFEHFLIDVQMGPVLCTSRIKQAISVVQLFVQRCLIGLEPSVPKNTLVRAKWDWMQQYSLWEANRKLFLYPENWLDPSLRDDKSPLFEKFEASLMQKNLTPVTFVDAIRAYIAGLNEIASLDVVAYAHEQVHEAKDTFHLFGRTRSAPHSFYYRRLTVQWPSGARLWRPWSAIEIDIPSVESDWDGSRSTGSGAYILPVVVPGGRLYIFLPQIAPKTLERKPNDSDKLKKFDDFRSTAVNEMAPRRIWEITMAWTELVSEQWSPKRMSPGSVTVESGTMPAVTAFRVDTITNSVSRAVRLVVSYTNSNDGLATVVGYFVFRNDQIHAVDLPVGAFAPAGVYALNRKLPSSFQQISVDVDIEKEGSQYAKMSLPEASKSERQEEKPEVLAWVPDAIEKLNRKSSDPKKQHIDLPRGQLPLKKITWTLAMDSKEEKLTGLALSASGADGTCKSYFNIPDSKGRGLWWTWDSMRENMDTVVLDHVSSTELMQAATDQTNPLKSVFDLISSSASSFGLESFGAYEDEGCHELGQPSAIYNWEIGLHSVMMAMDRFHASQQFDEALQIARLVFDPTIDTDVKRLMKNVSTNAQPGNEQEADVKSEVVVSLLAASAARIDSDQTTLTVQKQPLGSAWRFPPFQDIARRIAEEKIKSPIATDTQTGPDSNRELQAAILERRSHGTLVHATARGRPEAYMKWIVMKYVEILIASGDVHFRKATLESLPLATQRYIEAIHVLGPEPPQVARFGDHKSIGRDSTFDDLSRGRDPWTFERLYQENMNFGIRLPFSPELKLIQGAATSGDKDKAKENVVGFLLTPYFGVPLNPKFAQVRSVIKQRLFNVRNSLDIDGRPISYALIEPSIDPGALVALSAAGLSSADALAMVMGDRDSPLPRQRFDFLIHRALDLCGEVRSLGERLMIAIEKKEGETFGVLRAKHATAIQQMMHDIKETHIVESQQTIDSLQLNRDSLTSQLAYYLALLGESESLIPSRKAAWNDLKQDIDKPSQGELRMSEYEELEMSLATWAMGLNVASAGIDALVAPFCMVPSVSINAMPMGVGTTVAAGGGSNIATCMQAGSAAIKMAAMVVAERGNQAARKAQLTRQLQERRLQANIRGREIKGVDKQIEIQETRLKAAEQELEMQNAEVEESKQVEAWLRSKYTNEALYSWVEKTLRALRGALSFENGRRMSVLRPGGYWDASRDGLLAADHLYLDLKRLEAAHREGRRHDYEISKTISLRQVDPLALMRLRISGSTTFSLSEMLFDLDFPGHYMRRIRSVAVSVPAVLSPHCGINATLTLQQHKYRVSQTASTSEEYATSWSKISAGNDEAFRTDRVPVSAVAVSSGNHDPGVFELNFAGERYLPFEGAGVISSWRLDLPQEIARFDYNSIADVQLHIQYTSLDGGACLRGAANGAVRSALNTGHENGFWAMWNLKNDFVNEWYDFSTQIAAARENRSASTEDSNITMTLGDLEERLPFWAKRIGKLEARGITFVTKHKGLLDALTVSVAEGTSESTEILDWQVRSYKNLQEKNWKNWTIAVQTNSLNQEDEVGDVYILVLYGKQSS